MPQGHFVKVYSVSSEDASFPATNLLKRNSGKKWKTKEVGEKSAYVVLQLDKPEKITGIDIGNEFSSFIMVSVGRPTYSSDEFKEILITCSFMTPVESKNSTNMNRVRCFAASSLVEDVAKEKWDLVKIVCTQPFNRHVQYGLSFVTVHVAESKGTSSQSSSAAVQKPTSSLNQLQIASFKLREDSPDSESETSSGLFSRWKQSRKDPMSAAASIRAASRAIGSSDAKDLPTTSRIEIKTGGKTNSRIDVNDEKPKDRNRNDLLYDKADDSPNERLEKKIAEDRNRLLKKKEAVEQQNKKQTSTFAKIKDTSADEKMQTSGTSHDKRQHTTSPSKKDQNSKTFDENGKYSAKTSEKVKTDGESNRKRASSSNSDRVTPAKKVRQEKSVEFREFKRLLQGVVLVISGIQNPDRGILRQKAVELGAKYKPDWDDSCTHLICAFKNTPKYNQVRGKGKIVTRSWIEKCHSLKKRLPWRRFALDDREAEKPESEDEIFDMSLKPPDVAPEPKDAAANDQKNSSRVETAPVRPNIDASQPEKDLSQQKAICDDDVIMQYDNDQASYFVSSGSDTDEDIQKALENKATDRTEERRTRVETTKVPKNETLTPTKVKPSTSASSIQKNKSLLVYEASTDEDETLKIPDLDKSDSKTLFEGLSFHIKDNFSATDLIKVKQQIEQFKGQLVEDISDANYVISKEKIPDRSGFKDEEDNLSVVERMVEMVHSSAVPPILKVVGDYVFSQKDAVETI